MPHEYHYKWEWQLASDPETYWPLISDTNRSNLNTGLPSVTQLLKPDERLPNARRALRFFRLGVRVDWEEEPFEWVRPYRFGVVRRYSAGPVGELRTLAELTPRASGGTHLVYQAWATPRNLLGYLAIPGQIGLLSRLTFDREFRALDRVAAQKTDHPMIIMPPGPVTFAPGGRRRLAALRQNLLEQGADDFLLTQLVEVLSTLDDLSLARMRPYALADAWDVKRRSVLELCLSATRAGLLEFRWEVLCPMCRGAKQSDASLGQLQTQVHCSTCNIDFTANFERSVELTFRPNLAIRQVEAREFCIAGPQTTPHVFMQQLLRAGEERAVVVSLEAGRYRLRALELAGGQYLAAEPQGAAQLAAPISNAGWATDEPRVNLQPTLQLKNDTQQEQLVLLERLAWSDQAVTAAEVTTLQMFRDLFAQEALRPGESISVGSLTVVFTDLRNSTHMYREIGDAVAFGHVMRHFDILREAIDVENGALVKTIGDSVMAVFTHPVAALRTLLQVQHRLANPPEGGFPLQLKAGINYGPCIAVTLNDRLDYFGSTVNLAARLEGQSAQGGIVIAPSVRYDPEVVQYLDGLKDLVRLEAFATAIKGFDEERFELWRVMLVQADQFLNASSAAS